MKILILTAVFSTAIFLAGCRKENTIDDPALVNAKMELMTTLSDGQEVNTLVELHDYVKNHGFTDAVNGVPFRVVNGVLVKGMMEEGGLVVEGKNGLLPDKTPILSRETAFQLKVIAATEAFIMSIFNPNAGALQALGIHLRDVQKENFAWLTAGAIYNNFGLPNPSKGFSHGVDSEGWYIWETTHKQYLSSLLQTHLNYTGGIPSSSIPAATYITGFRQVLMQAYVPQPYSVGEALPWAMSPSRNVGASIDAYYFNIYDKGDGAGAISDILFDQNGQRAGVMVNIVSAITGETVYMYIGDAVQEGAVTFHWNSTNPSDIYDPWAIIPDFSILLPVAGGPPVINPGGPGNPGGSGPGGL